jgi:hypothetical protein
LNDTRLPTTLVAASASYSEGRRKPPLSVLETEHGRGKKPQQPFGGEERQYAGEGK